MRNTASKSTFGNVQELSRLEDPGVVDQDVDPAVRLQGARHKCVGLLLVPHTAVHKNGTQHICQSRTVHLVGVGNDYVRLFAGKLTVAGFTNTLPTASTIQTRPDNPKLISDDIKTSFLDHLGLTS